MSPLSQALELQKSGRFDEAAAIYSQVLATRPNDPDALHLLGLVHLERQRYDAAIDHIERALRVRPGAAAFHHNLAAALRAVGRLEHCREHYETAIRLRPDYAEAYFNWSAVHKARAGDAAPARIDSLLESGEFNETDRGFLHFAAGKLYDDLGEYDRAFQHYRAGNDLLSGNFDPQQHERYVEEIIGAFDAEFLAARQAQGYADSTPILVVGMPRSGTTLTEQILASHPRVFGAGELPDVPAIAGTLPRYAGAGATYPTCVSQLDNTVFAGFGEAYIKRLRTISRAERVVDKLPGNFMHLGLIAAMLPQAKIVACRRDPLDNCLSCYFHRFRSGHAYSNRLDHLGFYYRQHERLMDHWRRTLPLPIFDLEYEALLADQEGVTRALLEHCELEWSDACLKQDKTDRVVATASSWQVRQPIDRRRAGRAQRYERHLGPLREALVGTT